MLILNAVSNRAALPGGLRPDILLLGADRERGTLPPETIVLRYLQPPDGVAQILGDLADLPLQDRFPGDTSLVYLDAAAGAVAPKPDPPCHAKVETSFSPDGRLVQLRLDGGIVSSPLWPVFLTALRDALVGDRQFVGLLSEFFLDIPA